MITWICQIKAVKWVLWGKCSWNLLRQHKMEKVISEVIDPHSVFVSVESKPFLRVENSSCFLLAKSTFAFDPLHSHLHLCHHCNHDDGGLLPPARFAVWLFEQHRPVEERWGSRWWRVPGALCHPGHSYRWTVALLCAQTYGHTKVRCSFRNIHSWLLHFIYTEELWCSSFTIGWVLFTMYVVLSQWWPHLPYLPRRKQRRGTTVSVRLHGNPGHGAQELLGEVVVVFKHQLLRALPHRVQHRAPTQASHRGNKGQCPSPRLHQSFSYVIELWIFFLHPICLLACIHACYYNTSSWLT